MNEQERALYDAHADHEAWSLAHDILEPWVRAPRPIGSDELTRVMERALAGVEAEINRTLGVLEKRREEAGIPNDYLWVLEYLARSRGFSGAEELARRAAELDPGYAVWELLKAPPSGFGAALDAVLHMNEEERVRLQKAFVATFMYPDGAERGGGLPPAE